MHSASPLVLAREAYFDAITSPFPHIPTTLTPGTESIHLLRDLLGWPCCLRDLGRPAYIVLKEFEAHPIYIHNVDNVQA
ncbi:hypothetical protein M422DRAFT_37458 [Sphaerobolus stellatus SS14]|uniref:Uncharacterized protein n=1 Tax=Sphaerobolus stellatus (strain SS14) TaxID=990650 RepID=A0A0C9U1U2_SPHS4|nr:hypothetical protein M422DRAFT_37458 [Sphaerobolus stellatus SS14]